MYFRLILIFFMSISVRASITDLSECDLEIQPIGCLPVDGNRTLFPTQVMNGRDKYSKVFKSPELSWLKYSQWLPNFICECGKLVLSQKNINSDTIAIEFYGECWANLGEKLTLDTHVRSSRCVTSGFQPVSENIHTCLAYAGKDTTAFAYKVTKKEKPCPVYHESRGCYAIDNPTDAMEKLLTTTTHVKISHSPCVCAAAAREKGYRYFGIFYDDECWAHRYPLTNLQKSTNCLDETEKECKATPGVCRAVQCVGDSKSIQMYEVNQGPLACASNPCENGAQCLTKGLSGFTCVCRGKYIGKYCEIDKEACKDCDKIKY